MADQIAEVKLKTDIVSVIGERIELKKAGRNFKAVCPFHSEKTPSFMVSPELQIYKCFGCQASGDVFAFLEAYEGMEFGEALKYLAEKAGVKLEPIQGRDSGEKEKLFNINLFANKFYQYFLHTHPVGKVALEYLLKERGLKLATIKEFELGFSPDNPIALKKFLLEKKKFDPRDVEAAGIGYPKGGYFIDRFRGRVIFPLFDHRGNVVGFAGRILPTAPNQDTAKYINTPETKLYHKGSLLYGLNLNKKNIKLKETAIVVEGELDAISSWQAGVKNVVAIKGSALTEDQVRLLSRFAKKAILCLDSDIAGDAAARRGVIIAQEQGMEVKVARLRDYKDPDDAARANPEAFKKSLIDAVGIWDFLIDSVFERFNNTSGEGKAKISREVVPILNLITDKIVQAYYIGVVAGKLGVSEEVVWAQVQKGAESKNSKEDVVVVPEVERVEGRRDLLEQRLLSLGFRYEERLLSDKSLAGLIKTPLPSRILEEYCNYIKNHKKFDSSKFAGEIPKELFDGFAEMVLTEDFELDNPAEAPKEIGIVKHELKVLTIKEDLNRISEEIKKSEKESTSEKMDNLKEKFNKLTQKLHSLEEKSAQGIILEEN